MALIKKLFSTLSSGNFILFFIVSGAGLCLDLAIFFLLGKAGLDVFFANLISGSTAVSFVYFCSTKHVFEESRFSVKNFTVFASYYAISIFCFSLLIKFIVVNFVLLPILAKILVVPISLATNYFFASRICDNSSKSPSEATR